MQAGFERRNSSFLPVDSRQNRGEINRLGDAFRGVFERFQTRGNIRQEGEDFGAGVVVFFAGLLINSEQANGVRDVIFSGDCLRLNDFEFVLCEPDRDALKSHFFHLCLWGLVLSYARRGDLPPAAGRFRAGAVWRVGGCRAAAARGFWVGQ